MDAPTAIVWFRHDLRLGDNPALHAALAVGNVIPVYIWSPEEEGSWPPGGASRWWLHQSLTRLAEHLQKLGSRLILRHGSSLNCLQTLAAETGASSVFWNRRYEPSVIDRDKCIKQTLQDASLEACSFNGSLLFEPWEIKNKQGKPFQVFTPFWKNCLARDANLDPLPTPATLPSPNDWPASDELVDWQLEPTIPWDAGIRETWTVGEVAAHEQLQQFVAELMTEYKDQRDFMAIEATSRLSPYLHFGEVSPRQIWVEVQAALAGSEGEHRGATHFLSEVGWREFGYHLLYHFPDTSTLALRKNFRDFPWSNNAENLRRWQRGQTGYPVVDAAMRQLWHTGWMHNRARMIVASFLCKHLLIPWQRGAEWFWDTLVDADLASNTLGWQWTAGCGADAAPYFRIFNPITQGEKFDPAGEYIRRWVPELAALPNKWLYQPWAAPDEVLADAGVALGSDYPEPIVDHPTARQAALDAYQAVKVEK
ncbi:MAG: deoxyribodipyrimidine photo-lyase [Planctomycetota bacterium]